MLKRICCFAGLAAMSSLMTIAACAMRDNIVNPPDVNLSIQRPDWPVNHVLDDLLKIKLAANVWRASHGEIKDAQFLRLATFESNKNILQLDDGEQDGAIQLRNARTKQKLELAMNSQREIWGLRFIGIDRESCEMLTMNSFESTRTSWFGGKSSLEWFSKVIVNEDVYNTNLKGQEQKNAQEKMRTSCKDINIIEFRGL